MHIGRLTCALSLSVVRQPAKGESLTTLVRQTRVMSTDSPLLAISPLPIYSTVLIRPTTFYSTNLVALQQMGKPTSDQLKQQEVGLLLIRLASRYLFP